MTHEEVRHMIILSILIPSIPDRFLKLDILCGKLQNQITYCKKYHPTLGEIEVLVNDSKRFLDGGLSIGLKRDELVQRSTGKYICFLDDDEDISGSYVETLLRLCQYNFDVCCFRNISKMDNYWTVIDMSLSYENEQASPDKIVRRKPWHICPVKSAYAKLHRFEDSNYGEDFQWMERVLAHCKTEAKTNAVIHQYNHGKHSEADRITNAI